MRAHPRLTSRVRRRRAAGVRERILICKVFPRPLSPSMHLHAAEHVQSGRRLIQHVSIISISTTEHRCSTPRPRADTQSPVLGRPLVRLASCAMRSADFSRGKGRGPGWGSHIFITLLICRGERVTVIRSFSHSTSCWVRRGIDSQWPLSARHGTHMCRTYDRHLPVELVMRRRQSNRSVKTRQLGNTMTASRCLADCTPPYALRLVYAF